VVKKILISTLLFIVSINIGAIDLSVDRIRVKAEYVTSYDFSNDVIIQDSLPEKLEKKQGYYLYEFNEGVAKIITGYQFDDITDMAEQYLIKELDYTEFEIGSILIDVSSEFVYQVTGSNGAMFYLLFHYDHLGDLYLSTYFPYSSGVYHMLCKVVELE